jgi:peptidyl-prolyl cis-trans isomerase SurA
MTIRANNSMWMLPAIALTAAMCALPARAQASASAASSASEASGSLDHIVAIVNQDVILESDVQEEMRFSAFEPYHTQSAGTPRDQALERLINRTLIIQQEKLEPQAPVTDAEVQSQLQELRRSIPACEEYKCETEAGWVRYLADNDFTEQELEARWRERMEVLRFIEVRFRSGISISHQQVADYYRQTMLPAYAKQNATPPPLDALSARIEEVLLQRQVTSLLNDWLKTLREQGSVRTLQAGEEAP